MSSDDLSNELDRLIGALLKARNATHNAAEKAELRRQEDALFEQWSLLLRAENAAAAPGYAQLLAEVSAARSAAQAAEQDIQKVAATIQQVATVMGKVAELVAKVA